MKLLEHSFRSTCVLFALILLNSNLFAQKHLDIGLAHNWNFLDRDIEVSIERFKGKIGIKAGLNYFQFTAPESVSYERNYAAYLDQKIGFHVAILYRGVLPDSEVELAPFLKLSGFYVGDKVQVDNLTVGTYAPYNKLNTAFGLQVKTKLTGKVMLFGNLESGARWDLFGPRYSQQNQPVSFNGLTAGGSVGLAWRLT